MKKSAYLLLLFAAAHISDAQAQGFKNIVKAVAPKIAQPDSTGTSVSTKWPAGLTQLNSDEISNGLKEALQIGTEKGTQKLAAVDGFFKDAAIKILMPEAASNVEQKLRTLGMGRLVDDAILSMNRAAEDAAKQATPIFLQAIKEMSIGDAIAILRGTDTAATVYLKNKTTSSLTTAFKPVIEASLKKVNATEYWNAVFSTYNKFSLHKVNTDLVAYVTGKALAGIFYQIGLEEKDIRQHPAARTTSLLKKVFDK